MAIADNIKRLRTSKEWTQEQLAEKVGVTRSTVTQWETGWSQPRMGAVERLASAFGVTVPDMVSDGDERAASEGRPVTGMAMGYVPLRCRVHAGTPVAMEILDERGDMVLCPQFLIDRYPDIWAGQSEGDCMNNVYPEGCIYFVTASKPHRNGQPEVWTIDGSDTVARRAYQTSETLLLSPDSTNPENKDIIIRADDDHYAEYEGAIVWFQSNGEVE